MKPSFQHLKPANKIADSLKTIKNHLFKGGGFRNKPEIRKPGSVLADHLSSPGVATWIKRTIGELWRETIPLPGNESPPCSRQGLPFHDVTTTNCELLPRSFHPCPLKMPR